MCLFIHECIYYSFNLLLYPDIKADPGEFVWRFFRLHSEGEPHAKQEEEDVVFSASF